MAQVFVSYSSKEADQANKLVHKLEQAGIQCWIAPRDIPIGSDYTNEIPEAIEACPTFLLLLSQNSQASRWVKLELTMASSDNRYILPLQIEDFSPKKSFVFLLGNNQIKPYYAKPEEITAELIHLLRQQQQPLSTAFRDLQNRPPARGRTDRWFLLETLRSSMLNAMLEDSEDLSVEETEEFQQIFEDIKAASHDELIEFAIEALRESISVDTNNTETIRKLLIDQLSAAADNISPAFAEDMARLRRDIHQASANDLCDFLSDLLSQTQ